MKTYVIRPGCSFRMPDGSLKNGGELIELPSDVALAHAASVDLAPEPEAALPTLDLPQIDAPA